MLQPKLATDSLLVTSSLSLTTRVVGGTTDDFTTIFLHFSVHHCPLGFGELQVCSFPDVVFPPLLLSALSSSLFTVLCKMVLARPGERETCPYHCSVRLFTMVRRSSCGPIACWVLARTFSLVTWSLYEVRSILRQHLISMACILLRSTSVRVHDSQAYRKMDVAQCILSVTMHTEDLSLKQTNKQTKTYSKY